LPGLRTPSPSQSPPLTNAGHPGRHYRLPKRYEDLPPEPPAPLPPPTPVPVIRRVILHVRDTIRTSLNRFGLLREYPRRPSYDPDASLESEDLVNWDASRTFEPSDSNPTARSFLPPWPFRNMSVFLLMEWLNSGSNLKSVGETDRLVNGVLRHPEFKASDFEGFSTRRENQRLDKADADAVGTPFSGDGWTTSAVHISVPTGQKDPTGTGHSFTIQGLHHRSLLGVLKAALADVSSKRFHFSPFKRFRVLSFGREERCYDEVYTSDAFLQADDTLQKQKNEPNCNLEKVVLGLMLWSDSTHLANFGNAKAWPIYLYFANLSKYIQAKPTSGSSHHIAYIPSVSVGI
jgi:Plavaka transposase